MPTNVTSLARTTAPIGTIGFRVPHPFKDEHAKERIKRIRENLKGRILRHTPRVTWTLYVHHYPRSTAVIIVCDNYQAMVTAFKWCKHFIAENYGLRADMYAPNFHNKRSEEEVKWAKRMEAMLRYERPTFLRWIKNLPPLCDAPNPNTNFREDVWSAQADMTRFDEKHLYELNAAADGEHLGTRFNDAYAHPLKDEWGFEYKIDDPFPRPHYVETFSKTSISEADLVSYHWRFQFTAWVTLHKDPCGARSSALFTALIENANLGRTLQWGWRQIPNNQMNRFEYIIVVNNVAEFNQVRNTLAKMFHEDHNQIDGYWITKLWPLVGYHDECNVYDALELAEFSDLLSEHERVHKLSLEKLHLGQPNLSGGQRLIPEELTAEVRPKEFFDDSTGLYMLDTPTTLRFRQTRQERQYYEALKELYPTEEKPAITYECIEATEGSLKSPHHPSHPNNDTEEEEEAEAAYHKKSKSAVPFLSPMPKSADDDRNKSFAKTAEDLEIKTFLLQVDDNDKKPPAKTKEELNVPEDGDHVMTDRVAMDAKANAKSLPHSAEDANHNAQDNCYNFRSGHKRKFKK